MSAEAHAADEVTTLAAKRTALRLAFGVTCCFVLAEALNWDATFLGPLLASQLLVKMQRPPTLAQGLGVVVLIAASMIGVLVVSTSLVSNPITLLLCLGLLHYLAFFMHLRGAPEFPTLMIQTAGVAIPVLVVASPFIATTFNSMLISAAIVAIATVWAAFAAFAAPDGDEAVVAVAQKLDPASAASSALLKTCILMPILAWFVLDASQNATVVLIMIVTILRLVDSDAGWRVALGLTIANLIGGVAATVAYNFVKIGGSLAVLSAVVLCLSLVFAGRIVTAGEKAPIFVVAFAAFILLLGSGLSPIPGGSEEAALTRVLNVVLATAYAAGALTVLQSFFVRRSNIYALSRQP